MSFNGIKDMEIRKYYDIEYVAKATGPKNILIKYLSNR